MGAAFATPRCSPSRARRSAGQRSTSAGSCRDRGVPHSERPRQLRLRAKRHGHEWNVLNFLGVNGFSPRRRGLGALVATISACALISGWGEAARANPVIPNDPGFATQWADRNPGQPIPDEEHPTGTPFADERSAEAWALTTGSPSIVIGETDTGVDYEHPDLAANI